MAAKECDNLIPYLSGELSEAEKASFIEHLNHCPTCEEELQALRETWFALSYDRTEKQAPEQLKTEVMDYIFQDRFHSHPKRPLLPVWFNVFKESFSPLSAVLVAVLLLGCIGLLWNNVHLRNVGVSHEWVTQGTPAQIKDTFILQATGPRGIGEGVVYLVREGTQRRLVMLLSDMPKTTDKEVYRAWLIYDGNYQNCGSFQPNRNGRAVLTYRLPPGSHFEEIEITLEPNLRNSQPHGQTFMETL